MQLPHWAVRFATRKPPINPDERRAILQYSSQASRFWRYELVEGDSPEDAIEVLRLHYPDALDIQVKPANYVTFLLYASGKRDWAA